MSFFPISERIDMYNVYIECNRNSSEAKRQYTERYPERDQPHRTLFKKIEEKILRCGSFADQPPDNRNVPNNRENDEINILAYFETHPRNSTRDVARELNISQSTVIRILRKHHYKSWKLKPVQLLKEEDKIQRVAFCNNILLRHRQNPNFIKNIVWTDESSFSTSGIFNRGITHYWSRHNPRQFQEIQFQGRQTVNVWCGVAQNQIIGPIFYYGALTGQRYLNLLQNEIAEYVDDFNLQYRNIMVWQQDGAPQHNILPVRNFLNHNYNLWIGKNGTIPWPPRSPDLTPLDFYLWGHLKSKIYEHRPNNLNELQDRINAEIMNLNNDRNIFRKIENSLLKRLNLCVNEGGGHIEHLL